MKKIASPLRVLAVCAYFLALAFFLSSCGKTEGPSVILIPGGGAQGAKEQSKMEIWAHRGCSYAYPENTLQAFKAASALDITGVELDVQLTKDKKLVVIHDETVDRTTNGSGAVSDFTLQELQALKIQAPGGFERVPTLEEVLALLKPVCQKKGLMINIELKTSRVRYEGIEEIALKAVSDYGLEDYALYSSFLQESILIIKQKNPLAKTAILNSSLKSCLEFAQGHSCDGLHPHVGHLDVAGVRDATSLPIRAWGSPEPFYPNAGDCPKQDLSALSAQGVTGIFTNAPEEYCR